MAFNNKAAVGKSFLVLGYIATDTTADSTPPADNEFEPIGGSRDLAYGPEWGTADTTSRDSGNQATSLVTFKEGNIDVSGLFLIDNEFSHEFYDHCDNPPASTNGQPYAWIRIFEPRDGGAGVTRDYPVIVGSFRISAPHAAESTYDMTLLVQGDPVVNDVAAPTP